MESIHVNSALINKSVQHYVLATNRNNLRVCYKICRESFGWNWTGVGPQNWLLLFIRLRENWRGDRGTCCPAKHVKQVNAQSGTHLEKPATPVEPQRRPVEFQHILRSSEIEEAATGQKTNRLTVHRFSHDGVFVCVCGVSRGKNLQENSAWASGKQNAVARIVRRRTLSGKCGRLWGERTRDTLQSWRIYVRNGPRTTVNRARRNGSAMFLIFGETCECAMVFASFLDIIRIVDWSAVARRWLTYMFCAHGKLGDFHSPVTVITYTYCNLALLHEKCDRSEQLPYYKKPHACADSIITGKDCWSVEVFFHVCLSFRPPAHRWRHYIIVGVIHTI